MAFEIEVVPPEEIGEKAKSKWETLFSHILAAHKRDNGGVFVAGFQKKDAQNLSQSTRRMPEADGLRLRWKQGTRNEQDGVFLWLTPDMRPVEEPEVPSGGPA